MINKTGIAIALLAATLYSGGAFAETNTTQAGQNQGSSNNSCSGPAGCPTPASDASSDTND